MLQSAAAWTALSAMPWACRAGPDTSGLPNVLFVLSDSHRAKATGCYGDPQVATPSFDAFATEGVRLTTAISNTPLCRPYRASLMSGAYGHHTGMLTNISDINFGVDERGQWRPPGATWGETFAAAGYRCGYVGKWHLGSVNVDRGELRFGFDDYWATAKKPAHDYFRWTYQVGVDRTISGQGRFRPAVETDMALEFIDECEGGDDERPWMVVLSWGPPHDPLTPPPRFVPRYEGMELPPNVATPEGLSAARVELPLYYALVEAIDHEFGRLMRALDERGLRDDTVVVYTSDHGVMIGSHDLSGKEMPYDEALRVPFLARWPGRLPAGRTVPMPFGAPDVFPTMAGLAGVAVPSGLDGADFSGRLRGEADAPGQDVTYIAAHETNVVPRPGWRGVRTERFVYARKESGPWLLFDVENDPYELDNLVGRDSAREAEMDGLLTERMASLGDRWRLV